VDKIFRTNLKQHKIMGLFKRRTISTPTSTSFYNDSPSINTGNTNTVLSADDITRIKDSIKADVSLIAELKANITGFVKYFYSASDSLTTIGGAKRVGMPLMNGSAWDWTKYIPGSITVVLISNQMPMNVMADITEGLGSPSSAIEATLSRTKLYLDITNGQLYFGSTTNSVDGIFVMFGVK
jgi:hypothetical protein